MGIATIAQFDGKDELAACLIARANELIQLMAETSADTVIMALEVAEPIWGELNISQLSIACNNKHYFTMPVVTNGNPLVCLFN